MTDVIAWPPFHLTGWELDEEHPQSRSVGLIQGRPRTSSALRSRRVATAMTAGIGQDSSGAGYVRMLKRIWAGNPRLVRIECHSTLWFRARLGLDLTNALLEWTHDSADLLWTAGGVNLLWGDGVYALEGQSAADGGWNSLLVTGLPPNRIVARPSELISLTNGDGVQQAYVISVARSDGQGSALIRTDRESVFVGAGLISIGHREVGVFEALQMPRAVQPVKGVFGYQWDLREVFEDESPDGWAEVNPWG